MVTEIRFCFRCGCRVHERKSSTWLAIQDNQNLFCTVRCAAQYGITQAVAAQYGITQAVVNNMPKPALAA